MNFLTSFGLTIAFLIFVFFVLPIIFVCLLELFENLFIELFPLNIKRKYYFRSWGKSLFKDILFALQVLIFKSSLRRRMSVLTDQEREDYVKSIEVYK
jgi:hypothetical protein